MVVSKAAKYLLANSEIYDEANIQIDTDWLNGQHDENFEDTRNTIDHIISSGPTFISEDNSLDTDQVNDSYDELDEDDMQTGIVDMDTMLHKQDIPQRHVTPKDVVTTMLEELTLHKAKGRNLQVCMKILILNTWHFQLYFVDNRELIIRIKIYLSTTVISVNMNCNWSIGEQQKMYQIYFSS